jgi:hypothetical protein
VSELGRNVERRDRARRPLEPCRRTTAELLLGAAVREGRPRIVGVGAEVGGESRHCSSLRSAEWLPGWPSVGRPQALIV